MSKVLSTTILGVLLLASSAAAQAPEPLTLPQGGVGWQPPDTSGEGRPDAVPPGYHFYGRADDLLLWAERDQKVNVPASTGPEVGDFGAQLHFGARLVLGLWLEPGQTSAVELGGLWADQTAPGQHDANGTAAALASMTERFWDGEINYRAEIYRGTWAHFDLLAGFKHLSLDESLTTAFRPAGGGGVALDGVSAFNRVYAGQLGAEAEVHWDQWFVDLWGKAGLGYNQETAEISVFPGAGVNRLSRDELSFVPEVGINLGYQWSQHIRFTVGYTFLYLSSAARPAEPVQGLLQSTPAETGISQSSIWIQGCNLGAEFRF